MAVMDVVVVGGGVAGLSAAWQLAQRGQRVVVLEKSRCGSGASGRAAGLMGQLRGSREQMRILRNGLAILRSLEQSTGRSLFIETGSVRIAITAERTAEIHDLLPVGESTGVPIRLVSRDELALLLPHMRVDDVIEACLCPTDGHIRPAELVQAYLDAGRALGVEYRENTPVEEILIANGRAIGVRTAEQVWSAPVILNAVGPWSGMLVESAGSYLETTAIGHCYLTTQPFAGTVIDPRCPAVRDRELRIYARPEKGGWIVGRYEPLPTAIAMRDLPSDFDMARMTAPRADWDPEPLLAAARHRFPWIDTHIPMQFTAGIMTFTPDSRPLVGARPDIAGLYHAAGFSGHGIVQSPIIGSIAADLILEGRSDYDLTELAASRFWDLPDFKTSPQIEAACLAMYANYYGRIERIQLS